MAQLLPRRAALMALTLWRTETRFADAIIAGFFAKQNSLARSRFRVGIIYGALRNLTLLDFLDRLSPLRPFGCRSSRCLADRSLPTFFVSIRHRMPPFRNSRARRKKQRRIVNAILRNAIRQRDELFARARAQPLFLRRSHPQFLVTRWQANLSESGRGIVHLE